MPYQPENSISPQGPSTRGVGGGGGGGVGGDIGRAIARCKILTNIMPTHVKISIEPGIRELFRF